MAGITTPRHRKVRCPRCTALFKKPSSPSFECPICAHLFSGENSGKLYSSSQEENLEKVADATVLHRQNDADFQKEEIKGMKGQETTDHPKAEQMAVDESNESLVFESQKETVRSEDQTLCSIKDQGYKTGPTQSVVSETDVQSFQTPVCTPRQSQSDILNKAGQNSSNRSFSDLDSGSHSDVDSDFDFPTSSPENMYQGNSALQIDRFPEEDKSRVDVVSTASTERELGLVINDGNVYPKNETNHVNRDVEQLSEAVDAIEMSSSVKKGMDANQEAEATTDHALWHSKCLPKVAHVSPTGQCGSITLEKEYCQSSEVHDNSRLVPDNTWLQAHDPKIGNGMDNEGFRDHDRREVLCSTSTLNNPATCVESLANKLADMDMLDYHDQPGSKMIVLDDTSDSGIAIDEKRILSTDVLDSTESLGQDEMTSVPTLQTDVDTQNILRESELWNQARNMQSFQREATKTVSINNNNPTVGHSLSTAGRNSPSKLERLVPFVEEMQNVVLVGKPHKMDQPKQNSFNKEEFQDIQDTLSFQAALTGQQTLLNSSITNMTGKISYGHINSGGSSDRTQIYEHVRDVSDMHVHRIEGIEHYGGKHNVTQSDMTMKCGQFSNTQFSEPHSLKPSVFREARDTNSTQGGGFHYHQREGRDINNIQSGGFHYHQSAHSSQAYIPYSCNSQQCLHKSVASPTFMASSLTCSCQVSSQSLVPPSPKQNHLLGVCAYRHVSPAYTPCIQHAHIPEHMMPQNLFHQSCMACQTVPVAHQPVALEHSCYPIHHVHVPVHVQTKSFVGFDQEGPSSLWEKMTFIKKKKIYPPLPTGGSAPYVVCKYCDRILQLPAIRIHFDSRNRAKIRCSDCRGVSKFSVGHVSKGQICPEGVLTTSVYPIRDSAVATSVHPIQDSAVVTSVNSHLGQSRDLYPEAAPFQSATLDVESLTTEGSGYAQYDLVEQMRSLLKENARQIPSMENSSQKAYVSASRGSLQGQEFSSCKLHGEANNDYLHSSSPSTTCTSSPVENYFSDGVDRKNVEPRTVHVCASDENPQMLTNNHKVHVRNPAYAPEKTRAVRPVDEYQKPVYMKRQGGPGSPLIELFNEESRKNGFIEGPWSLYYQPKGPVPSDVGGGKEQDNMRIHAPSVQHLSRQAKHLAGRLKKSLKDFGRGQLKLSQREVMINGLCVPDMVVKRAEDKAGTLSAGSYWYDYHTGFWGVLGGPTLGIVPPRIEELHFPLPRDCSGGETGVLVNGRELDDTELQSLASRGLPTTSGKDYHLDFAGRVIDRTSGKQVTSIGDLPSMFKQRLFKNGMHQPSNLSPQPRVDRSYPLVE